MKKIKPIHPIEFLTEEFLLDQDKAQALMSDGVSEENIKELCEQTGWPESMWIGIQEQYEKDVKGEGEFTGKMFHDLERRGIFYGDKSKKERDACDKLFLKLSEEYVAKLITKEKE